MPVVLVHQGSGLTKRRTTRSPFVGSPAGRAPSNFACRLAGRRLVDAHVAGDAPGGFRVVDVWESEEAAGRFGEKLSPMLREVGIEAEPEMYPAHTFVFGLAASVGQYVGTRTVLYRRLNSRSLLPLGL